MANAEPKQQYEGAILQQLIKNSERLVVIENEVTKISPLEEKVDYIYSSIKWIIGLLGAILIAVLANLLSQPILSIFG
ncbi:hypothetical protein I4641_02340 [Waterburya agarophytonicola K14]|uniref:Uncharacterized protein n=1 Tax=Waterburya agarophytonicola KI4 TaxID=2874699 RepID=A0A964BQ21_9CYAN|nr:hypothetical protein [Waterburya agarophytonicola]MCC0175820.1 hypothetical protein [Waterburya agarophytonicola KI4]